MTDSRLTAEMIRTFTERGLWGDDRLHHFLARGARQHPDRLAAVSPARGGARPVRLTYARLHAEAEQAAAALGALGLGRGDVVSLQLPNWYEFMVIALAASRIGAVINGIPIIYRHYEMRFILQRTAAKLVVVPAAFRGFDHAAMVADLRPELPDLAHVVLVAESAPAGMISYDDFLARGRGAAAPADAGSANDLVQVAFTSGTTGEPKGVMHTHNTLIATVRGVIDCLALGAPQVNLVISPVGHQTGFLWGILTTLVLGGTVVFQDRWDPQAAMEAIGREGVTTIAGATPFLREMTYAPNLTAEKVQSLRTFITAGAPIPPVVVQDAAERLGCKVHSAWGMTEYGIATAVGAPDPQERAATSDGRAVTGAEIRVADDAGLPAGAGQEGDLQVRGAGLFIGYFKRPDFTADSFTPDGWLLTGDRAVMDAAGFIRLTGRTKDIIIRGGENIPVAEIESMLYAHPLVQDVAVVAMPDERLGERACAYVVPRPGGEGLKLADLVDFLLAQKIARQKLPERLELIDGLPRTASGKVQKFRLREEIRRKLAGG